MKTRLTEALGITCPVIQAPMAFAAGGALARAVTQAGGLGMIGGAYGDVGWIEQQFTAAAGARTGCGLITWKLAEQPHLLDLVLAQDPAAVFLSFGNPAPFAPAIRDAGVPLICQVQTLRDARQALDCGADILVAQGADAGGHGEARGTFALVPEIADEIACRNSTALLCAAGGITDGRGLAAALMLGADGAVVGTRFWASHEALVHPRILDRALAATGDDTIRTKVVDVVRGYDWPARYNGRVLRNSFIQKWHGSEDALRMEAGAEAAKWLAAQDAGDPDVATAIAGEGIGLIRSAAPAGRILADLMDDAQQCLARAAAAMGVPAPA
ncbi:MULTISPECIES: NAD(P)H-dependent flavin oxidoreductase [unclassified Leisingera]|uniref:NAD(P)H-dependent flavin oxidoreductase n=1 Tax=unclassified Leisingera TaxID=2614906 RepID=UPI0002F4A916|nr:MULTISPECIES: nitronate monooxygenase [unclassified Leisingera]KIC52248.1 oxidoreductase [Leisingera sp. ANG-S]KID09806.1 oxidoreductase [Leisingera sp. ANG1]